MNFKKKPFKPVKRVLKSRKKLVRLKKHADKVYPAPEKMGFRVWLQRFLWRNSPRIGFLRGKAPVRTTNYANFYRWAVLKTANELLRSERKSPVVIMVGGMAGSGKTTLAERLAYTFSDVFAPLSVKVAIVPLDGYFKTREKTQIKDKQGRVVREKSKINGRVIPGEFDNPKASDLKKAVRDIKAIKTGKQVSIDLRSVSTGKNYSMQIDPNTNIVIVEGLYCLHRPLATLADIRIGMLASLGDQFVVRSTRDINQRQREPTDVARKFVSREVLQRDFVTRDIIKNAELVLDRSGTKLGGTELEKWLLAVPGNIHYDKFLNSLNLDKSRTVQKMKKIN